RQYRAQLVGGADAFLAQFDTTKSNDASLVYSTYLGGTDVEEVRGIALDPAGKVLLTGYTLSRDFPTTSGAYRRDIAGNGDAFLIRFDPTAAPNAAVLYSTFLGGSGGDVSYEVVPDASGGAWVTGYTLSLDFPVAGGPVQASNVGGVEVFVSHLDMTKQGAAGLLYSTYLGGTGVHVGYGLAVGSDGTVFVGGYT